MLTLEYIHKHWCTTCVSIVLPVSETMSGDDDRFKPDAGSGIDMSDAALHGCRNVRETVAAWPCSGPSSRCWLQLLACLLLLHVDLAAKWHLTPDLGRTLTLQDVRAPCWCSSMLLCFVAAANRLSESDLGQ